MRTSLLDTNTIKLEQRFQHQTEVVLSSCKGLAIPACAVLDLLFRTAKNKM
jgi:hypothetical protein